jgi:hypothetical protein
VGSYKSFSRKKTVILNVVVICVVCWLPFAFGMVNYSDGIRVPQIQ